MEYSKTFYCSLKFRWAREGIFPKFTIRARALKRVRQAWTKSLSGSQNWCGRFGDHIKVLSLTGIERRNLDRPARRQVTILTKLSRIRYGTVRKKYLISCSKLMHHLFIIFINFLYMFRAILCSSSGGFIVYMQHLVLCMSLFLGDIQRTRCMYRMNLPDDEHKVARNM